MTNDISKNSAFLTPLTGQQIADEDHAYWFIDTYIAKRLIAPGYIP